MRTFTIKEAWLTPIAILVGSLIIAASIFLSGTEAGSTAPSQAPQPQVKISAVTKSDHILGNPNAKVMIVEYSDTECPFCKRLHSTLHQVIDTLGKNSDIAWVFRHFPVHKNSVKEGVALECAAELGGNEVFWKYTDKVFATTQSNDSLDLNLLPVFAKDLGLDVKKFNDCITSGRYEQKILAQRDEAAASGAQGTPWSVVLSAGKEPVVVKGASTYETMANIIQNALKK